MTPYDRRYRQAALDLLFRCFQVHTHLDWQETSDWLDSQRAPMRLGWDGRQLVGLMAASTPLNATCWLRLIAVRDTEPVELILGALWGDLCAELRAAGVQTVALLIINDWLLPYVAQLGFHYQEHIVTLRRASRVLPPTPAAPVAVRSAGLDDLETLLRVDQAAFPPPWQMPFGDLRQAWRIAASCTVAVRESVIVGYQLSTLFQDTLHLARLAVAPPHQKAGVGAALLDDLIRRYLKRGIHTMTVNTQESNQRSQRLYTRYAFQRNGYDLPIWLAQL